MTTDNPITFAVQDKDPADSVCGFVSQLLDYRQSVSKRKIWYRGQSRASDGLLSSIGRKHEYSGKMLGFDRDMEQQLLHRFRRRAYPHVGRSLTAGEALFLARHHRLPTRLLDWSANALVGLYFACIQEADVDGMLWGAVRREDSEDLNAFDLAERKGEPELFRLLEARKPSIKLLHPFYNSPRILAQDGAFTVQNDPWRTLESYAGEPFNQINLDIDRLLRWRIPSTAKTRIIEELSGLGFTHRIVYPDLDGIAQSLWETEVLYRGT